MQVSNFAVIIALLFSAKSFCQTVYTWVDEDGTLHFDDAPNHSQAQAIDLPDFAQPALPPQFGHSEPAQTKPKPVAPMPLSVTITSPENNQAIRSNNGFLSVKATLNRKLKVGEQLQLTLDGKNYGALTTTPNWQLKNIDRGSHSLTIQVVKDGKLIASSLPTTVHLQRTTMKPAEISPKA
ncbi:DUF4124 domain-containing protein [Vibrio sp. TBV020]|uniref:DUF4124 domain-containing protein n=1 Tax=Vibrio sp. TBV020 TaxID=3137398 RepID=UPI0038CD69D6